MSSSKVPRIGDTGGQVAADKLAARQTAKSPCVLVAQSCLTLCDPMDCSPQGSSVHGILQARILGWLAISSSRGPSPSGDQTQVSCIADSFVLEPAGKLLAPFISKSPKFVPTTFYSLGKSLCGITIGNVRDVDLIPGSGRCPGGGRGHWPQYACLENAMDRGAWWATVHGVSRSPTWPKWLSAQALTCRRKSRWNDKEIDHCLS